jgi:GNAT superfamily N-acetyltransferase
MSTKNDIEYGRATKAELPAVVELCMAVEEQHERYWKLRWARREGLPERYLGWFGKRMKDPDMYIAVARDRGRGGADGKSVVAGMVLANILEEIPIYTFTHYAMVQDLAVRPEYRRQGVARRLLEETAAWARGQGVNQLRLMVAEQNAEARKLFDDMGFRPTYQEMVLGL